MIDILKRKFAKPIQVKSLLETYKFNQRFVEALDYPGNKFIIDSDEVITDIPSLKYLFETGFKLSEDLLHPLLPKALHDRKNEKDILEIFEKLGYSVSSIKIVDRYHQNEIDDFKCDWYDPNKHDSQSGALNEYREHVIRQLQDTLNRETEYVNLPKPKPLYE
ncbi:MAG: hypothetical protein ACRCS6_04435 [Turicibacter sp.]